MERNEKIMKGKESKEKNSSLIKGRQIGRQAGS
jgi:hypothetical protein